MNSGPVPYFHPSSPLSLSPAPSEFRLSSLVMDHANLPQGQALLDEIARLRKSLNAVVLAHYYQDGEIQDLADFVGDSFQFSQVVAKT